MSQRRARVPRTIGEVHPISDTSKLLWERYYLPMQSAAQALNGAIANTQNILGAIIIEMEGYSPTTHLFDVDNLRIIRRPESTGNNGAIQQ